MTYINTPRRKCISLKYTEAHAEAHVRGWLLAPGGDGASPRSLLSLGLRASNSSHRRTQLSRAWAEKALCLPVPSVLYTWAPKSPLVRWWPLSLRAPMTTSMLNPWHPAQATDPTVGWRVRARTQVGQEPPGQQPRQPCAQAAGQRASPWCARRR